MRQGLGPLDLVRWTSCKCGHDLAYIGPSGWTCGDCHLVRVDLDWLGAGPAAEGPNLALGHAAHLPEGNSAITIRRAAAEDEAGWRELWSAYILFSRAEIRSEVTNATWRRIVAPDGPMAALLAVDASDVLGFAVYVLHEFTFDDRPACLLDDMYVRADARGSGVGKLLLSSLMRLAEHENWGRVYWMAAANNTVARRMFDQHFCGGFDGHVRYSVSRGQRSLVAPGQAYDGTSGRYLRPAADP